MSQVRYSERHDLTSAAKNHENSICNFTFDGSDTVGEAIWSLPVAGYSSAQGSTDTCLYEFCYDLLLSITVSLRTLEYVRQLVTATPSMAQNSDPEIFQEETSRH